MYKVEDLHRLTVIEKTSEYGDEIHKFGNEVATVYAPMIYFENQEEADFVADVLEKSKNLKFFEVLSFKDKEVVDNFINALYLIDCNKTPTVQAVSFGCPEEIKIIAFALHSWLYHLRYDMQVRNLNDYPGAKVLSRFVVILWNLLSPVFRLEYDFSADINDYTYEFEHPECLCGVVIPNEWLPVSVRQKK